MFAADPRKTLNAILYVVENKLYLVEHASTIWFSTLIAAMVPVWSEKQVG
jgi:hypothetical protein